MGGKRIGAGKIRHSRKAGLVRSGFQHMPERPMLTADAKVQHGDDMGKEPSRRSLNEYPFGRNAAWRVGTRMRKSLV
jgi:hypothetical protein